jgi:hypothetical protein
MISSLSSKSRGFRRDIRGAMGALIAFAAAIGVVVLLRALGLAGNTPIVLSLLLIPVFVYALASGRLREIHIPGGWLASFANATHVSFHDYEMVPIRAIEVREKFERPPDGVLRRHPTVLQIQLGAVPHEFPLCEYLYFLDSRFATATVRYLVVVDSDGAFVAMAPLKSIPEVWDLVTREGECRAGLLVRWIEERDEVNLARLRGFIWASEAAGRDWDTRRCLVEMLNLGVEALPVVQDRWLVGIVESGRLATALVADLANRLEERP